MHNTQVKLRLLKIWVKMMDDEWDDDYTGPHVKNPAMPKPNKAQPKKYPKNPPNNISMRVFIISIILIIGIVACALIFLKSEISGKYLAPQEKQQNNFNLAGLKKLKKPLLGDNTDTDKLDSSDPLSNADFDFSVISSRKISRMAVLPDRMKLVKQEKDQNLEDFQNIWTNGNRQSKSTLDNIDSSKPEDFLPPWRRYSAEYMPTDGKPAISIVLEYDTRSLDLEAFPDDKSYNIVIPGFMKNSKELLNKLRQKGYEVLFYLPMEEKKSPLNFKPITHKSSFDDIRSAIDFHTEQLNREGFVGFMNYGGDIVRGDLPKMNFMMSLLRKTGHLYLDNITGKSKSLAFAAAEGQKVPAVQTRTYIDDFSTQWQPFIQQVKLDGKGIAVIKATLENLDILKKLDIIIAQENIALIPITGILKHKMLK